VVGSQSAENERRALVKRVWLQCYQDSERCLRCASAPCLTNAGEVRAEACERESGYEYLADRDGGGADADGGAREYRYEDADVHACRETLAGEVSPRAHGDDLPRHEYDGALPPEAGQGSPER